MPQAEGDRRRCWRSAEERECHGGGALLGVCDRECAAATEAGPASGSIVRKAEDVMDLVQRRAMAEQNGSLICRVNQLERELKAMTESRDYWRRGRATLAARSETELVSRTFEAKVGPFSVEIPLNALKRSR